MKRLLWPILALLLAGCAVIQKKPQRMAAIPGLPEAPVVPVRVMMARNLVAEPTMPPPLFARVLKSSGPFLLISITNLDNEPIVTSATTPPLTNGMVVAAGGTGTFTITCITGPAIRLEAVGLGSSNSMMLERATDLTNWMAYPVPGFQLTLGMTNPVACVPLEPLPAVYYRGRILTQ